MKFLDKLFNKDQKKKSVAFYSGNSMDGVNGYENFADALNLRTYKDSLYLFIGISMIRETVSSIPLELYKIKNTDGDVEEIYDDPVLSLLERPNYRQTQVEFWKLAVAYYLLAGETFWYLERANEKAVPTAMVNMRPDHIEIILSKDKREIVAYEFTQTDSTIVSLRPDEVLHIKNIDPTNPARGVGVVRPASQRIITEKEASKYQSNTFRNQGRPDIAVFTDVDIDEEGGQEARDNWNKIYGGNNGANAGFFGESVKDIKLLNVSPKEMDFINSQNFLRDDILAALHIPKAMITSDDVNLANAQTARIIYVKEACLPVLDAFIDILNNRFLNDMAEDKFITYENPVNEDRELVLKEAKELKEAGIITINEARAIMNYPEVDDGDVRESGAGSPFQLAMKQKRLRGIAKKLTKKRKVLYRKFVAQKAVAELLQAGREKEVRRERNSVFHTTEMKEKYIKAFNNNIDAKAKVFKDTVDVYNDGLYKRIVQRMEDFGINENNIFDVSEEIVAAKKIFVPLMTNMFEKEGQDTMDAIANGFSTKASEHFFTPKEIIQELELRAEFFILSMLNTDFKQLQSVIGSGLKEGLGVPAIARNLRKYFDDMSVARAKTIARTETGRLVSMATNDAYYQSDVVTGKEWLTSQDDQVRDKDGVNNHVINHGQIVATGKAQFPNGEEYPGQLTINCRCAIAPAV